ncbi:MAG TPA: FHA domain-containing protein [Bdellovibrionota bacterium]|jgi:pSer/pThr/pTyr-binding forkhead associated (FHA) protein
MIRISVYNADSLIKEFESGEDKEISIGRAAGCSIQLDEASISRLHAVIFPIDGGWTLQRKANFGAVLLNGTEVENAPLEGGEEIKIGNFSLRVQLDAGASPPVAEPPRAVTSSRSLVPSEDEGDGRTRFVSAGVSALFRMQPGSANLDEFLMEKDVVLFGRGSNCDVVLTEKKASRKHFEVRRQGLSFFLKDLNSANGTVVNGAAVTETELVAGDVIEVGESKIQFSIENREFFAKQDSFMPVPAHLSQPQAMDMGALGQGAGEVPAEGAEGAAAGGPELGPDGVPLPPKPNSSSDIVGWARYKWMSVPKAQRMRYYVILVVFAVVTAMLGTPDDEVKKAAPKPRNTDGSFVRRFEDLTPKNQKFVKDNYKELLSAHDRKDFTKMFESARNILSLVDEYNDTKSYESIAKRGLEAIEEEKKRKELEEKQRRVREEVAKLEEKGKETFERALKDPKVRPELEALIQEVYAKDPNNRLAAEWKQRIRDKIEEEKREEAAAKAKEELRQKAEEAFAAVEKTFKSKDYIKALKDVDTLVDVGWNEKDYLERIDKLREEIRGALKSVLEPLFAEARNQRQEGGDLVAARNAYNQVLQIDRDNLEARQGLNDIRQVLLLRAKRLYAEAILAESISDLQEAKEKYEKCLHVAPDDQNLPPNQDYRARCRRKLVRFEAFTPESSGKN